jgi:hypothetical protein
MAAVGMQLVQMHSYNMYYKRSAQCCLKSRGRLKVERAGRVCLSVRGASHGMDAAATAALHLDGERRLQWRRLDSCVAFRASRYCTIASQVEVAPPIVCTVFDEMCVRAQINISERGPFARVGKLSGSLFLHLTVAIFHLCAEINCGVVSH